MERQTDFSMVAAACWSNIADAARLRADPGLALVAP
jgi:hypothetical protein